MKAHPQHLWALFLCLFMLSGCAQLGLIDTPRVNSVKDGVAISYATIESGAEVTTGLLKEGLIDADEARFSQRILERAYALTQIAEREVLAGKPDSAEAILGTASRLLLDVQTFLGRDF